jgi:antitoxin CptB
MGSSDALDMGRLRWRCRRGMRELDELLTNYLTEQFPGANPAQRAAFVQLLDSPDADLNDYCLQLREAPSLALRDIIAQITTRSFSGH